MKGKGLFTWSIKSKGAKILHEHEYYGPLIDLYIESILKSGLLLDEDLEVLLNVSDFRNLLPISNYKPPISFLANVLSAISFSVLAKRYQIPLLFVPSVAVATHAIVSEAKKFRRRRNNRQIVDQLIAINNKTRNLNLSIIKYMKTRADLENVKITFTTLYNKSINDFMEFALLKENDFFHYTLNLLKTISSYSPELTDDYKCLVLINPFSILETSNIDSVESCLTLARKIQDLHVLFASKLLSYIGIVCCSKTSCLRDRDLDELLNRTLYNAEKYYQQHHDLVKKQFVTLRQSVNKKSKYVMQTAAKTSGNRQIQTKLRETLVGSVNNLSIILEKSQSILDATENADDLNTDEVSRAVVDLKNHTFATYEALDVLCKLYGVLSNSSARTENKITPLTRKDEDNDQPVINYDDSSEPLEEKFELYVGNEDLEPENTVSYDNDRSDQYLGLMLRELRQSLNQHQRFIDAKNKRGSEDEDDVLIKRDSPVELKHCAPKFDLSVLNADLNLPENTDDALLKEKAVLNIESAMPAPPPPPLPTFYVENLEEESGYVNARSMLENIKALSSQRNVKEEVFGD